MTECYYGKESFRQQKSSKGFNLLLCNGQSNKLCSGKLSAYRVNFSYEKKEYKRVPDVKRS